jgi:hypothetical protein
MVDHEAKPLPVANAGNAVNADEVDDVVRAALKDTVEMDTSELAALEKKAREESDAHKASSGSDG